MLEQGKKRVWIYCRSARDDGGALDSQLRNLTDYAEQEGYRIIGASQEIGSGLTLDHPELNKIKDFDNNTIDTLLVRDFARISRDVCKTHDFVDMMEQKGIEIISLAQGTLDISAYDEDMTEIFRIMRESNKKSRMGRKFKMKKRYLICQ